MARTKKTLLEAVEESYTESDYEPSEVTIVIASKPNRILANLLDGTPKQFPSECEEDLKVLLANNIAADFGKEGYARGHAWRAYIRKG